MAEVKKKCMICAKPVLTLKGGICEPCQDRIRREALGEQAGLGDRADQELIRHGGNAGQEVALKCIQVDCKPRIVPQKVRKIAEFLSGARHICW
jgi:hypothetical protein